MQAGFFRLNFPKNDIYIRTFETFTPNKIVFKIQTIIIREIFTNKFETVTIRTPISAFNRYDF